MGVRRNFGGREASVVDPEIHGVGGEEGGREASGVEENPGGRHYGEGREVEFLKDDSTSNGRGGGDESFQDDSTPNGKRRGVESSQYD